jgi:hypothetical protein
MGMSAETPDIAQEEARAILEKYSINGSHAAWDPVTDNWMSVELFRVMHDGRLPEPDDVSFDYVFDFLDDTELQSRLMAERKDFGSLYLTAMRMVYKRYEPFVPMPMRTAALPRNINPSYPRMVIKKKVKKNGKRR